MEHTFDGLTNRVNRRCGTGFSIEEADDYRELDLFLCYYPLGYYFTSSLDKENSSYTISVYDDNYNLYTQKTYTFQIPQDYYISTCNMHYAIMEEPFFEILLCDETRTKPNCLCAYNVDGKMIQELATGNISIWTGRGGGLFLSKGKMCFLVWDHGNNRTYLYSVQSPSRLASPMIEHQPAVMVAPDRLTVFSASGKTGVLNIYSLNGVLCDSKSLDTKGTTTYMTNKLKPGTYIYEVGNENGKFVVKGF